jgi:adenine-specific DNA-methyltransferase
MSKLEDLSKNELINIIAKQDKELKIKKYGLVWDSEREPEQVVLDCENNLPILKRIKSKEIKTNDSDDNILIEGDNYHSLTVLNYTHKEKIDVIYIDPPYNTGNKDFIYNDNYVDKEESFKHSKWLTFIEKRLKLAKNILSKTGVIIIHIDEHEQNSLHFLLNKIFGENNNLGTIVWNKKNPKGDSHGVSVMHESILCYAKDREKFLTLNNILMRPKLNAEKILRKARALIKKINKTVVPDEIKEVVKSFNFSEEVLCDFKITYTLSLINKEFQNWIKRQDFSNGEKAYRFIDDNGDVYRGVSMAWPNKKQAPKNYFIPLIHPISNQTCPVPRRGWRNPPETMQKLLKKKLILFGETEEKQPERKYLLKENLYENTNSIYENASSDDSLFTELEIDFPYPKPVSVSKYLLKAIHPKANIVCDFMAGSGTTGHAVLQLNNEDGGNRKFILCTNNENNICSAVCLPRINKVIKGYKKNGDGDNIEGINGNLQYFKTALLKKVKNRDQLKINLTRKCTEMLCVKENIFNQEKVETDFKIFSSNKKDRFLCVYYNFVDDSLQDFIEELKQIESNKIIYMFSLDNIIDKSIFSEIDNFKIEAIPQKILDIYKQLVKMNIPIKSNIIYTEFNKAKNKIFTEKEKNEGARILRIVLERLIQKISQINNISIINSKGKEEKISSLNDKLKKDKILNQIEWEENKTFMVIGNHASHGEYEEFNLKKVENFYKHIQNLLNRFEI